MRRIIAAEYLSLDGVMENPAWTAPYWNDELAQAQGELMHACGALLLGRITYEAFAAVWPGMDGVAGADRMNSLPKYVATTTLTEPAWNARFLRGDVPAAVRALKAQPGLPLLVYGSAALLDTLRRHDLVDEYRLMMYPLVLGTGKKLFREGSDRSKFRLLSSQPTSTGVLLLTYGREDAA